MYRQKNAKKQLYRRLKSWNECFASSNLKYNIFSLFRPSHRNPSNYSSNCSGNHHNNNKWRRRSHK